MKKKIRHMMISQENYSFLIKWEKNDKDRRNVQNTEQLHEENEKLNRLDSKF